VKKHALIAAAICISLSAVTLGLIRTYARRAQQQRPITADMSLREIANRRGQAVVAIDPRNLHRFDTLATLTHGSGNVVIGTIQSASSSLIGPRERMIVTDYQVTVSQSLKGSLQPNQAIIVREPGGRVQFEAGKFAQATLPDYWRNPEIGKSYVLFLESRPEGNFVLSGGPQGLFEITPTGNILPQGKNTDRLMQANNGKSTSAFTAEILKIQAQPRSTEETRPKPTVPGARPAPQKGRGLQS
jgi:hypothetical protein